MTDPLSYDELVKAVQPLNSKDKRRLAQWLIQQAKREEDARNPHKRISAPTTINSPGVIPYVAERLLKLKPARKAAVLNAIGTMFQFQGGVSEADRERILSELQRQRYLSINEHNRVSYGD
ncbi:MAG: hypothetical protein V2J55_08720 [Candidatus Competibacteraceae bacterium]|nr:hypothetical protein [Candidatus Competibacteraceae bacterium]